MIIDDKWYDVLKWVGSICCPALAIFIESLCNSVGWTWGGIAKDILIALGVLICSLLQVSSINYYQSANVESEIDEEAEG